MNICLFIYLSLYVFSVEVQQRALFLQELQNLGGKASSASHQLSKQEVDLMLERFAVSSLKRDTLRDIIDASLSTFLLHVESRVASSQGLGEHSFWHTSLLSCRQHASLFVR